MQFSILGTQNFFNARNYPKEIGFFEELVTIFLINWVLTWHYETFADIKNLLGSDCAFGVFTQTGICEILRSSSFVFVLAFLTRKCSAFSPLPYTWVFKELNKFLQEPECIKSFYRYIVEEEEDKLFLLEDYMKQTVMQVSAREKGRSSRNDRSGGNGMEIEEELTGDMLTQQLTASNTLYYGMGKYEIVDKLESAFSRFKLTVAY